MNLRDLIESSGNGAVVQQMARELGIDEGETRRAIDQMVPALARGIQRNAARPGGLDSLLDALGNGNHRRYVDQPQELGNAGAVADGNAILGHILGSKDVSRNVAGRAAADTGLDSGLLRKMLPILASVAMGVLSQQSSDGGSLGQLRRPQGGSSGSSAMDVLSGFLDADRDGSVVDDLLNLAQKFF